MAWRPGAAAGAGPGRELLAASGGTCRLWDSYRTWLAGALRGGDSRAGGPPPGHAPALRTTHAPMSSGCPMLPVWRRSLLLRTRIGRRPGVVKGRDRSVIVGCITLAMARNRWTVRPRRGTRTGARFLPTSSRGAQRHGAGAVGPSATAHALGHPRGAQRRGAQPPGAGATATARRNRRCRSAARAKAQVSAGFCPLGRRPLCHGLCQVFAPA